MTDTDCSCCPDDVRHERHAIGLPPCRRNAAPRILGVVLASHKADREIVVGTRETLSILTRNDRRRDRRFKLNTSCG